MDMGIMLFCQTDPKMEGKRDLAQGVQAANVLWSCGVKERADRVENYGYFIIQQMERIETQHSLVNIFIRSRTMPSFKHFVGLTIQAQGNMTAQVHRAQILQCHVFDQGVVTSQEPGRVWGDQ